MGNFICSIFKSPLFYIILSLLVIFSIIIGINLGIYFLYFFLIDQFLPDYYYLKYILILILFLFNYFLIRRNIIHCLFVWQYPFQCFSIYRERQNYVSYLKEIVTEFLKSLEVLLSDKYILTEKEIVVISNFLELFDDEFYNYDNLYNIVYADNGIHNNNLIRYKMSNKQIKYYNILKSINNILIENDFRDKLKNLNLYNNNFFNSKKIESEQDDISKLTHIKILINNELLPIIENYDCENYTFMSPAYIFNSIFNDTFGSLSLYSLQFKKNFQDYSLEENYSSNGKIHYTLIRNIKNNNNLNKTNENEEIREEENLLIKEDEKNDDGALIFFSLPNGGCYEMIPQQKIVFYLTHGFSFLCWNYRGYGFSKGSCNFSNCKEDALDVFDTIIKSKKYNFKKICVMGHSIGGIPTSYIAKNRDVDMIILDRNFCDIPRIALNFHCGNVLNIMLKLFLIGNTNIIEDIMEEEQLKNFNDKNINKVNKIIVYSSIDHLIVNDCTVKSGISRYFIKNFIFYKNTENIIIKSKENFLDLIFNKNEKNLFLNDLISLIHMNHILSHDFNDENNNIKKDIIAHDEIDIISNEKDDISFLFFEKFFGISCDNFSYIAEKEMSIRRQKIFLDNFFNNLLIWGAQGEEIFPNEETFEFYSYKGLKLIKEAYDILNKNKLNENLDMSKKNNILIRKNFILGNLKIYFEKILYVMHNLQIEDKSNNNKKNIFTSNLDNTNIKEKLIMTEDDKEEINTNNTNDNNGIINKKIENSNDNLINEDIFNENKFYQKLNKIKRNFKLFRTYAGHNGPFRTAENEQFFYLLLKTGIIN